MIGIILVTHGRLADEFLSAMEHVVGRQEQIMTIAMGPDDDIDLRRNELLSQINTINDGSGVVILTDMFGGTPSNLAISVMEPGNIEVIAGVNLPMLIKLAEVRKNCDVDKAMQETQDAGRKYINSASVLLKS